MYLNAALKATATHSSVRIQAYADDILVWSLLDSDGGVSHLQDGLNDVVRTLDELGLKLSPNKCLAMTLQKRVQACDCPLFINDAQVKETTVIKYLGLLIDQRLKWKFQILDVSGRAFNRLTGLQRMVKKLSGLSPALTHSIVKRSIEPLMYYGAAIWGSKQSALQHLKALDKVIRRCGITTSSAVRTCSYPSVYRLAGLRPSHIEISDVILKYGSRLAKLGKSSLDCRGWTSNTSSPLETALQNEVRRIQRKRKTEDLLRSRL